MTGKFVAAVNPESGPHAVRLMFPVLREQAALRRDLALLDALRDLDREALAPKFLAVLDSEHETRERHKRHPAYLDRLCGKYSRCQNNPCLLLFLAGVEYRRRDTLSFRHWWQAVSDRLHLDFLHKK